MGHLDQSEHGFIFRCWTGVCRSFGFHKDDCNHFFQTAALKTTTQWTVPRDQWAGLTPVPEKHEWIQRTDCQQSSNQQRRLSPNRYCVYQRLCRWKYSLKRISAHCCRQSMNGRFTLGCERMLKTTVSSVEEGLVKNDIKLHMWDPVFSQN